jgi:hypothetical protein
LVNDEEEAEIHEFNLKESQQKSPVRTGLYK